MSIYTRAGDQGTTTLHSRSRHLPKSHFIFSSLGQLDEVNSLLGLVVSTKPHSTTQKLIREIQTTLFAISSEIATPQGKTPPFRLNQSHVRRLEKWIDEIETALPPLKHFLFPAGTTPAAFLFYARAVTRRAEISLVRLSQKQSVNPQILAYMNRLSDLLFVLARFENHKSKIKDIVWPGSS